MRIGKDHALCCDAIHVWRSDHAALGVQALHIAVAHIIGENVDDIWIRPFDSALDRRARHRRLRCLCEG